MPDQLLPVVVVHGVGVGDNRDRAGYSRSLSNAVTDALRPVIRVGPKEVPVLNPVPETSIVWEEALWEGENDVVDDQIALALKLAVRSNLTRALAKKALDLLIDVPLYLGPQGEYIRNVVKAVIAKHPHCVLVGHSLGSVISYEILRQAQEQDNFNCLPVSAFVTLGSPLSLLFSCLPPTSQMKKEFPFKWENFYYPNDLVCARKPLDRMRYLSVCNHSLSAEMSWGDAHTAYWSASTISDSIYRLTCGKG